MLKENNKKIADSVVKGYKKIETKVISYSKNLKNKIKKSKSNQSSDIFVSEDELIKENETVDLEMKKGFVKTTFDTMCTGAKKHFEVTKETFSSIKNDSKERIEYAKENNEYLQDFITAPNAKDKTKAVITYAKDSGKTLVKRMKVKR